MAPALWNKTIPLSRAARSGETTSADRGRSAYTIIFYEKKKTFSSVKRQSEPGKLLGGRTRRYVTVGWLVKNGRGPKNGRPTTQSAGNRRWKCQRKKERRQIKTKKNSKPRDECAVLVNDPDDLQVSERWAIAPRSGPLASVPYRFPDAREEAANQAHAILHPGRCATRINRRNPTPTIHRRRISAERLHRAPSDGPALVRPLERPEWTRESRENISLGTAAKDRRVRTHEGVEPVAGEVGLVERNATLIGAPR